MSGFPGDKAQRKAKGPRQRAETNTEFVRRMMEYSQYGALAQCFILDAIDKWANKIGNMPKEQFEKEWGQTANMIHPDAWQGVAREIATKLRERVFT